MQRKGLHCSEINVIGLFLRDEAATVQDEIDKKITH
jgi:hypothetical protein